jgi:hypothetical protein
MESDMAARRRLGVVVVCLVATTSAFAVVAGGREPAKLPTSSQGTAAGQEGPTKSTKSTGRVSVAVVFAGDAKFDDAVKATCQDLHSDKLQDCFAKEMKRANATPAAVEFSRQLGEPGFVRDFKVAGPVDLAYVFYPYRANENQSCLIVNGEPAIIDVDNHKLVGADALKRNAAYVALAKAHKEVSLWPGDRYGTETPDVEMGANAGAHIVVNYRLREQCHACAVLGHAWFSFDFDPKGKFGGAKLMGVSLAREKAVVVRDANKPVTTSVGEEVTIALPVKAGASSEWMLTKALDTGKVRLIEHSHVAPPSENGAAGEDELWKFAALGAGATEIEFQRAGEKVVRFKVAVRGRAGGSAAPVARRKE